MVKVLKSGFYTSIQDMGRVGFLEYGVPVSGAMDLYAVKVSNALLGNHEYSAVMEITMLGPKLEFDCKTNICISGADMSPKLNETPFEINKVIRISKGDVVSFGALKFGFRCYLAVSGGFKTETVLQGRSMYKGVTKQFKIEKNDVLPMEETSWGSARKNAALKINRSYFHSEQIEVFEGPEFKQLSEGQRKFLFSNAFTISKENNRMAYQLDDIMENQLEPIVTSAVLPGTVQLTPFGKLIVLMRDCQTTGGYPRVLQLKESAINSLAQKYTGDIINFELVKY